MEKRLSFLSVEVLKCFRAETAGNPDMTVADVRTRGRAQCSVNDSGFRCWQAPDNIPVPMTARSAHKSGCFSSRLPHGTYQSAADRLSCQRRAREPPVMQTCSRSPTHGWTVNATKISQPLLQRLLHLREIGALSKRRRHFPEPC